MARTAFNRSVGHREFVQSRREFLCRAGAGCGALALALMEAASARGSDAAAPKSPTRLPHFPAKAKSIIWIFADGGASHIDLFDPKPELAKLAGRPLPDSFARPETSMGGTANSALLASKRKFQQHGQSGAWVSDWLPHLAECVDDLAIIRSTVADGQTHVGSVSQMNTGSILAGYPAWGSWLLYGLGSEADNLPGYIVLADDSDDPPGSWRNWGAGFMPAVYQGTRLRDGKEPILFLQPADDSAASQRDKLDFIQQLNRRHAAQRAEDDRLEARIAAYELAYRMQTSAPDVLSASGETAQTLEMYGFNEPETAANARNCLLARRLVERGVRCVQLYTGSGSRWDAHADVEANHSELCRATDKPIAALLKDLKQRGLLDSTLVVWAGEFGRTPMSESGNGRDHNPWGFTTWLAGGGVKAGQTYGRTDEIGLYTVENKVHIHDLHATILHLLGLNHLNLTWSHNGRDERLTITEGEVVKGLVG